MSTDVEKTQALQARLIVKAWEDETFKQLLMSDPKTAIVQEFGLEIPEDVEIEVVEETPNKLYLVLPTKQIKETELSEEQLEAVAGGRGGGPTQGFPMYYGFGRMSVVLGLFSSSGGGGEATPIPLP